MSLRCGKKGRRNENSTQVTTRKDWISVRDVFSNGFVMAMVLFSSTLLQGLLSQASTHANNTAGIRIKLGLQVSLNTLCQEPTSPQGLLYRKCLRLPASVAGEQQPKKDVSSGNVVNLISEDTTNVMMFFWMG